MSIVSKSDDIERLLRLFLRLLLNIDNFEESLLSGPKRSTTKDFKQKRGIVQNKCQN